MWANVVLTVLNLFGIWRWLGRQAKVEEGARAAAEASEQPRRSAVPGGAADPAPRSIASGAPHGHCVDAMAGAAAGG